MTQLKRISGLDGLRAFAVMLVFISHMFMVVPELLGQFTSIRFC